MLIFWKVNDVPGLILDPSKKPSTSSIHLLVAYNMFLVQEILIASGNQEQLGHACTSANNPELALKFVSSSSAKDNSEDKTPNFTNIRNNQMKQSSPCHEDFTSYSFPSKKKIKLSDSNGSIMRSRPNRMLTERNVSETSSHIKEMPNETEDKQSDFMSKKAESTGTRRLKKPVMADQPPAKIESPYLGKRIVSYISLLKPSYFCTSCTSNFIGSYMSKV